MAIEAVEHYLLDILATALVKSGVSISFTQNIVETVRIQIYSCLIHWMDIPFRKALLIIGAEEGMFYIPDGKKDVKCFVVVTIRNSPFETVQSKKYILAGLTKALSDDSIKVLTGEAITYFNKLNFTELSSNVHNTKSYDIYGELAGKYPVSWEALMQLSGSTEKKTVYQKAATNCPYFLDGVGNAKTACESDKIQKVVLDGYSSEIDSALASTLGCVAAGTTSFFSPCFKTVTRNMEKLLRIIEFVLTHDRAFVTNNYYIENGYIERRAKLIKAHVSGNQFTELPEWSAGLGYKHKAILKGIYNL